MPHGRRAIHDAIREANNALYDAESGTIGEASSLGELTGALGLSSGTATAIGMIHPELQDVVLGAIKSAGAAGRPINLTWAHGTMQGVHVRSPGPTDSDFPIDIEIQSRFDEDGLGAGGTTS